MKIEPADVAKVALLARLDLTEDEMQALAVDLSSIVDYVRQLDAVNTADVAPMAHAIDECNVMAKDEIVPPLPRELALANAPRHDGECYLVPAVLGE